METGDTTVEGLEMAAVKEGNRTLVADDIAWCASQINWLCKWHVVNYYSVILNYCYRIVANQIGHQVVQFSLSSVQI